MSIDLSQFYQSFFEESFELLEDFEKTLLEIDIDKYDVEQVNTIFRVIHSIKGNSGTFNFTAIRDFTHVLETYLNQVRNNNTRLTLNSVQVLLNSTDCLRVMLVELQKDLTVDVETENSKKIIELVQSYIDRKEDDSYSGCEVKADIEKINNELDDLSTEIKLPNRIETTSIRVSVDKIDELINNVGELVIVQLMIQDITDSFAMHKLQELKEAVSVLVNTSRDLRDGVLRIRMLPVSYVFNRYSRMVKNLESRLGKRINLNISGEHTELDKTVLEKISDPIAHIIRNSADHGLETTRERKKTSKPEVGQIFLNAYYEGGGVIVEIGDDGKGLNKEKIKNKAIENKIIKPEDDYSDDEIYSLIFEPGFSTADEVTDLSGRGVGMDVVKTNITDLGGSIDVHSIVGEGAIFVVRLPLTLAIIESQLIRICNQTFIISMVSIVESIKIDESNISHVTLNSEVYKFRNQFIPIIRVCDQFKLDKKLSREKYLVIVDVQGKLIGLAVDELLSQQQVVIKNFSQNYKKIEGISGATILADGEVGLIIDVYGLVNASITNWAGNSKLPDEILEAGD